MLFLHFSIALIIAIATKRGVLSSAIWIHDFSKEGIQILRDGDFLYADGTTLGADNGYAVAVMLAILENTDAEHPALECLFTSAEEVGLDGMRAVDPAWLNARLMINLDS